MLRRVNTEKVSLPRALENNLECYLQLSSVNLSQFSTRLSYQMGKTNELPGISIFGSHFPWRFITYKWLHMFWLTSDYSRGISENSHHWVRWAVKYVNLWGILDSAKNRLGKLLCAFFSICVIEKQIIIHFPE